VCSVFSVVIICFGFEWIFSLPSRCVVVRLPAKVEGKTPSQFLLSAAVAC